MMRILTLAAVAAVCAIGQSPSPVTAAAPGDELIGLWGAETTFGPQVRGELTLERGGAQWVIRIAGFEASAKQSSEDVRVALPGGQGEFRARVLADPLRVTGFWIQPEGNRGPYATPILMRRIRPGLWRGTVAPLDDELSLYLAISRDSDGTLRGSFHNPEWNWNGRGWYRITVTAGRLRLSDPSTGKPAFELPYDASQRAITMEFGSPFALTPRKTDQAVGFEPTSGIAHPYKYREPLPRQDGWLTADAATAGLDSARLSALVERLTSGDPATPGALRAHSVLVARGGRIVLEEYFYGFTAERLHDLRSASKTFTSVMLGAAMLRGTALDTKTPVYPLLRRPIDDPRKTRITLGQLLSHTSGLACDDNDDRSPGNENTMQSQATERDWYRYILDLPVAYDPGTHYAYCSGGMNAAGGAIAAATGQWLPELFDRQIAKPLQIEHYAMNLMPTGEAYSGGGVYMRPRDLLKFGQLYLNHGVWNGARIVPRRWVEESTSRIVSVPANGSSDGYGWHRYVLKAGGRDYDEYEANGNGGQFLIVVPSLDLAVVFTAGNYNQYAVWRTLRDELFPTYVMGAVRTPPQ